MKKITLFLTTICLALNVNAQYQVTNSNFEEWESVSNGKGEEPVHWSSFLTASGSLASFVSAVQLVKSTDVRPNSAGNYSAKITARSVFGVIAQGNMTTGQINGGSMSAGEASGNYNWTNTSNSDFNMPFTGYPDSLRVWINFYAGNSTYTGKISAFLHGNGYYQDPNTANTEKLVQLVGSAQGQPKRTATSSTYSASNWQLVTVPFEYVAGVNIRPSYALVSFATNSSPGTGTKDDWMYIDDMQMIYNSELETAKYDGNTITFNGTSATVDEYYDESKLVITSNGHGATVDPKMDPRTQKLTITIKGDNISEEPTNQHTYTIQFKPYGFDLLSLSYDGMPITGYEADGEAIDVILDEDFDESKLAYTVSEYAEADVDYDEDNAFLFIVVESKSGNSAEYDFNILRRGDVNRDGNVTIADVTALVNIILGKGETNALADVNKDDSVTIADVTALVNIILGK